MNSSDAPTPPGNRGLDRRRSKLLSLALRHRPQALSLSLDAEGWAPVSAVIAGLEATGLSTAVADLERVVRNCDKQRFLLDKDAKKIRANQGHSLDVNLGLTPQTPPSQLFHGTHRAAVGSITEQGLQKMRRQHVHLSSNLETARRVGSRRGTAVLLVVDAGKMHNDGYRFFKSNNGVWLTDHVPAMYIRRDVSPL